MTPIRRGARTVARASTAPGQRARLLRAATAALLVLLAAGCGSGAGARGISVRVARDPFAVSVLRDGRTVVAEDAARLRFRAGPGGGVYALTRVTAVDGDTYTVATTDPGRSATVSVTPGPRGVTVAVSLHPANDVEEIYDSFATSPGTHFLGGGERGATVDLAGQVLSVEVDANCAYAPVPFFASTAGWGLRIASEQLAGMAFPGSQGGSGCVFPGEHVCAFPPLTASTEVCVEGATLDEVLYVGSLAQVLGDYEADTGLPHVPPRSELELIKWRDTVTGPGQVLEDIHRLQAAGIPIGWVELDNPWEPCNGELTFDPSRIPNPRALIAQVHALGVRFMLWVSPKATCATGYPAGGVIGPATDRTLDLRDPAVLRIFERRLARLFALGVDGVKADRGDEVDFDALSPTLTNGYPLLYARAILAVMPKGDAAIFQAGTVGSQSVLPGIWAGDQAELWSGLQDAIVSAQTAAMSGFSTWGSDVGGYNAEGGLTPELFDRWAELGAISPVMEVGGQGLNATPWLLGAQSMAALRDAAELHYELFPYLYGVLEHHQPVLAPLGYAFPDDPHAWASPDELMVGPDLLAAPVTGPGTTPSVYLPAGSWVDLFSGATVSGGGPSFTRPTPDDQFPLYARAGSVIPFNLRTAHGSWWGLDELTHPGRAGFLVTDGALLSLHGLPAQVQLFVPSPSPPLRVTIGGRPVAARWEAGPLPGVVIRLHGPTLGGRLVVTVR